jgi:hypothetical protein
MNKQRAVETAERLRQRADVLAASYPDARRTPAHVRERIRSLREQAASIDAAVASPDGARATIDKGGGS